MVAVAAATSGAGRALDLAAEERLENSFCIVPEDPCSPCWTSLEISRGYTVRAKTRCEASEENRPAAQVVNAKKVTWQDKSAHRRGKAQESGRLQWILGDEIRHELAHESSMWMWPMLGNNTVSFIFEGAQRQHTKTCEGHTIENEM